MSDTEKKVCQKCKQVDKNLKECTDCGYIFCIHCIAPSHSGGDLSEIRPYCPDCGSNEIIDSE
jgi:late competence protein required for DNA uptake (superfamily II DNA/RNA helicase)